MNADTWVIIFLIEYTLWDLPNNLVLIVVGRFSRKNILEDDVQDKKGEKFPCHFIKGQ